MTMPDETATGDGIILMGDPRVTAVPASDNGEELIDVRDHGLRVSTSGPTTAVISRSSALVSPPGCSRPRRCSGRSACC